MQPFLSKKSNLKLKVFGWYQIVGGIAGLLLTFYLLAGTNLLTGLIVILFLIASGLYSFSIYCGKLLLTDKYRKGLNLSILNQSLQTVSITLFGYGYMYVAGLMFFAGIKAEHGVKFTFDFELTSSWHLLFNSGESTMEFAINFVAIYLIYFADKLISTTKKEQAAYKDALLSEDQLVQE